MTSQEHRDTAQRYLRVVAAGEFTDDEAWALRLAQVHATLAVYEGLYELLGDDGKLDQIRNLLAGEWRSR